MIKLFTHICLLVLLSSFTLNAQEGTERITLTLDEVVERAVKESPQALVARNKLLNKYWQNRTYKAEFLPTLSLDIPLVNWTRSPTQTILDDGTPAFVQNSYLNSDLTFRINQNINWTGGNVFVISGYQGIDLGGSNETYLSTPYLIGINQPILGFNRFNWRKKIEPKIYEEAKRAYLEEVEQIRVRAVNQFFNLLMEQINVDIATTNVTNNDTLYKISKGRYNLGKIAENDLLQMELSYLNAKTDLSQAQLDLQVRSFELQTFLGYDKKIMIELVAPAEFPIQTIDYDLALRQASTNRSDVIAFERKVLEAKRDVAEAKSENRFAADVFATYGVSANTNSVTDPLYPFTGNTVDRQQVRFGINIPILDWGRGKGRVAMARANEELVRVNVVQDQLGFEQEIYMTVMQHPIKIEQLKVALKADTIAQKRYYVTKQRYLIGKIDITDLNIAANERDMARRAMLGAQRSFWTNYFDIRRLTLYDMKTAQPLQFRFDF